MTPDVIALRAHLVAEVEYAKRQACRLQRDAADDAALGIGRTRNAPSRRVRGWQLDVWDAATTARTATDAWLAADARLRALDGLLAALEVA